MKTKQIRKKNYHLNGSPSIKTSGKQFPCYQRTNSQREDPVSYRVPQRKVCKDRKERNEMKAN